MSFVCVVLLLTSFILSVDSIFSLWTFCSILTGFTVVSFSSDLLNAFVIGVINNAPLNNNDTAIIPFFIFNTSS